MRVALTGSSGFIGSAVLRALSARGDEVVEVVHRDPAPGQIHLDVAAGTVDCSRLAGGEPGQLDGVVHLAGASIFARWTSRRRELIRSSRITTGHVLAAWLSSLEEGPSVYLTGSAVGFYGDTGESEIDEAAPSGEGFLAGVCRAWEAAADPAREAGIRVAAIRTGIVLGPGGGALRPQVPLFRRGLGGRLGSGRQWTSWVALDDEVAAILRILDDDQLSGPVNVTSPNPVRNGELAVALGAAFGRRAPFAVPAAGLRLALGREMADEMLLSGQRVAPRRLGEVGFEFGQPLLAGALDVALRP